MNPSCPITFSEEGRLLNGQHRLKAVVKSGKTVRMAVMRGVSVKDFSVIDTGMMRTSSDILSIAQVPNYTSVASIIGRYLYYSDANYGRMFTSREEVLDIYLADSEFWQYACQFARRLNDTKVRLLTVAEIGGIMGFLIKRRSHGNERVESFFLQLYGKQGSACKAVSALREKLTDALIRHNLNSRERIKYIKAAWNVFNAGKKSGLRVDLKKPYQFA